MTAESVNGQRKMQVMSRVKGRILDAENKKNVPFASVGIKGQALGSVSNELGDFEFIFPKELSNDTLYITALGFESYKIHLAEAIEESPMFIYLTPLRFEISEITISDIKTMDIIDRALNGIETNYSTSSYIMEGFYREYIEENDSAQSITEASVRILEQGYKKSRGRRPKEQVEIDEIKRSDDFRFFTGYKWDGLKYLLNENVQGHNPGGILNAYPLSDWEFSHEYNTNLEDEEVYVVEFHPKQKNLPRPEGTIYISTVDYAILKLDWSINTGLEKWHKSRVSDTTYSKYHKWDCSFQYKRIEEKVYLNYIQHNRSFFVNQFSNNESICSVDISNELFVNNIMRQNLLGAIQPEKERYYQVFKKPFIYNENFWDAFNLPPPSSKITAIYDRMELLNIRHPEMLIKEDTTANEVNLQIEEEENLTSKIISFPKKIIENVKLPSFKKEAIKSDKPSHAISRPSDPVKQIPTVKSESIHPPKKEDIKIRQTPPPWY